MFGVGRYSKRRDYDSSLASPSLKPVQKTLTPVPAPLPVISRSISRHEHDLAEQDYEELKEKESKTLRNKEIEIVCNGIKYRGLLIEEEALPELICEECEKAKSVLKCEDCKQVFCAKCFDYCHVRPEMGTVLHPHEINRSIRPIRVGDTSSIKIDRSFKMPDYEYYEQEMIQHKNLSIPNSLAVNGPLAPLSNQPCLPLKYRRGDILVYIDPISHHEVYGRVESDWDFRNGESAPSLLRGGEGGLTLYIIRYLGPVTPLVLARLERDEDPTTGQSTNQIPEEELEEARKSLSRQSMPVLEGVKSVNLRTERVLANRIDKRLHAAEYLRRYGPLHHLNPPIPRGFRSDGEDDHESSDMSIAENQSLGHSESSARQNGSMSRIGSTVATASHVKSTRPLTLIELRTQSLPNPVASRRTFEGVVAAYSLIAEVESSIYPHLPQYRIENEPPILERRQRIIILPECDLCKPSDRVKLNALRKKERIRTALTKRFAILFDDWIKYAFHHWVEWNHDYTKRIHSISALKIQTQFRRWLCRDILKDLKELSAERLHKKWLEVHSQFRYCSADTPGAVTMDNKIYFASHRDVNLYSRVLRVAVSKFVNVANRQRLQSLKDSFATWRLIVHEMKEVDMKITHWMNYQAMRDEKNEKLQRDRYKIETQNLHVQFQSEIEKILVEPPVDQGIDGRIDADPSDDSRYGVLSFPMALDRQDSRIGQRSYGNDHEKSVPPPWHPSVGFHDPKTIPQMMRANLIQLSQDTSSEGLSRAPSRAKSRGMVVNVPPHLPELFPLPNLVLKNKEASLTTVIEHSITDKQKYNSFRAKISGPTDYSCWIIPGRLAMGRIPLGKARQKGPVDSIIHSHTDSLSQILLVGLHSFVSLIEPEEEDEALSENPNDNIADDSKSITSISSTIMSPCSTASSQTRPYTNSIQDRVRKYHKELKMELKDHLMSLSDQMENKNIQLEEYINIDEPATYMTAEKLKRIEQQKKEKLRILAKKKIIQDEIDQTKKAIEKFPSTASWTSFPLKHSSVPPIDHIIPILWKLEQRLWQGECLYIYSKDGNGRAGMVCACLLGRLYGLTPAETLLRMQTYYDCQRSQYKKTPAPSKDGSITMSVAESVSGTCPQMRRQQELVSRILMMTNRVFQGVSYRSQLDPESFELQVEQPKRGVQMSAAMEAKWRSDPSYETKSSIFFDRDDNDDGSASSLYSESYQKSILGSCNYDDDSVHSSSTQSKSDLTTSSSVVPPLNCDLSPYLVGEVFTAPIVHSIGRRSSSVARVLPTSSPTVCDSPVKLRVT